MNLFLTYFVGKDLTTQATYNSINWWVGWDLFGDTSRYICQQASLTGWVHPRDRVSLQILYYQTYVL